MTWSLDDTALRNYLIFTILVVDASLLKLQHLDCYVCSRPIMLYTPS